MHLFNGATEPEDLWKGAVAGLVGGLAGSLAMEVYQLASSTVQRQYEHRQRDREHAARGQSPSPEHIRMASYLGAQYRPEDPEGQDEHTRAASAPAPARLASRVSRRLFGKRLEGRKKRMAGEAVHYSYGAAVGAAYGALSEVYPQVGVGEGSVFGAGVMVASDEVMVPALGLSGPPTEHPLSVHVDSFVAHLIYGVTCEIVRRAVRRLF